MPYITNIERKGIEKGLEQGIQQGIQRGESTILRRQLARRFEELPGWAEQRLESAGRDELESWADRVLEAERIEDVFEPSEEA
jgi:hypothetical protein